MLSAGFSLLSQRIVPPFHCIWITKTASLMLEVVVGFKFAEVFLIVLLGIVTDEDIWDAKF